MTTPDNHTASTTPVLIDASPSSIVEQTDIAKSDPGETVNPSIIIIDTDSNANNAADTTDGVPSTIITTATESDQQPTLPIIENEKDVTTPLIATVDDAAADDDASSSSESPSEPVQCEQCENTAQFRHPKTHAVYCSDTCCDRAYEPEATVLVMTTKKRMNLLVLPLSGRRVETIVYEKCSSDVAQPPALQLVFIKLAPLKPTGMIVDEHGELIFLDDDDDDDDEAVSNTAMTRHTSQLCMLRVEEQGVAKIEIFDAEKNLRVIHNVSHTQSNQCIIPRNTFYRVSNSSETSPLKLSRLLIAD